jgi:hypothetical protein
MATVTNVVLQFPERTDICRMRPVKHSAHEVVLGSSALLFSNDRLVAAANADTVCCLGLAALNPKSRRHIAIWQVKALQMQLSEDMFLIFVRDAMREAFNSHPELGSNSDDQPHVS